MKTFLAILFCVVTVQAQYVPRVSSPAVFNVKSYGATGNGATDDSAAIQNAINAADAAGGGVVYFPAGIYLCNGAFDGSTNSVLKIPLHTGTPVTIRFQGEINSSFSPNGAANSGVVIKCTKTGSGTRPALFAVKAYAATAAESDFNQVYPQFANIQFRVADNPSITVINAANAISLKVENCDFFPASDYANVVQPTTTTATAIYAPQLNNHANIAIQDVQIVGFYEGIRVGEHSTMRDARIAKCMVAVAAEQAYRPLYGHLTIEWCPVLVKFGTAATTVDLDLNVERATSGWYVGGANEITDTSNIARGFIGYKLTIAGVGNGTGRITFTGSSTLDFYNYYTHERVTTTGVGIGVIPTRTVSVMTDGSTAYLSLNPGSVEKWVFGSDASLGAGTNSYVLYANGAYRYQLTEGGNAIYPTATSMTLGDITWTKGSGSPEGVVTAKIGSHYSRTDGGTGTSLYVKESGTGNTGWVAK